MGGGQEGDVVKRDVIRLFEHDNGMRVVGMIGGTVNINNGVSVITVLKRS